MWLINLFKIKTELNERLLKSGTEELKASARIVEAEAKAGWFVSSWRPLLMYVLIFILVWNYILAPLVSAITHGTTIINFNLPGDVWTLLQIGLGGYVVGRSGESIARTIANRPTNQGDKDA
jgi:Holin of 3TMs, for gene-transfer release